MVMTTHRDSEDVYQMFLSKIELSISYINFLDIDHFLSES